MSNVLDYFAHHIPRTERAHRYIARRLADARRRPFDPRYPFPCGCGAVFLDASNRAEHKRAAGCP